MARALPPTDVFEFYWAHMIQDTTLGQVSSWLGSLLLRRRVPRRLRPVWLSAWCALLVIAAISVVGALEIGVPAGVATALGLLAVGGGLVWRLAGRGCTVLVALHDLNLAARFADHLVVLGAGTVAAEGTPSKGTDQLLGLCTAISACWMLALCLVLEASASQLW